MNREIKDLIEISKFYGADKNFVIAGGGNTSFKDRSNDLGKGQRPASGSLTEEGLVALSRGKASPDFRKNIFRRSG